MWHRSNVKLTKRGGGFTEGRPKEQTWHTGIYWGEELYVAFLVQRRHPELLVRKTQGSDQCLAFATYFSLLTPGETWDARARCAPAVWAEAAAFLKAILPFSSHLCFHFLYWTWKQPAPRPTPSLYRSTLSTWPGWWEDAPRDPTPAGEPAPWEERRMEPAPGGPATEPRQPPGAATLGAPRPAETSPECSLSSPRRVTRRQAARTPFFSWDCRPSNRALLAKPRAADSSCGKVGRGGRSGLEPRSKTGPELTLSPFPKGGAAERNGRSPKQRAYPFSTWSALHPISTSLLSACCVPGALLGAWEAVVNNMLKHLCSGNSAFF